MKRRQKRIREKAEKDKEKRAGAEEGGATEGQVTGTYSAWDETKVVTAAGETKDGASDLLPAFPL